MRKIPDPNLTPPKQVIRAFKKEMEDYDLNFRKAMEKFKKESREGEEDILDYLSTLHSDTQNYLRTLKETINNFLYPGFTVRGEGATDGSGELSVDVSQYSFSETPVAVANVVDNSNMYDVKIKSLTTGAVIFMTHDGTSAVSGVTITYLIIRRE